MGRTHRGWPTGNNHVPMSRGQKERYQMGVKLRIPNFRIGSPYNDDYADDSPYYRRYMRNYFPFRRHDYEF